LSAPTLPPPAPASPGDPGSTRFLLRDVLGCVLEVASPTGDDAVVTVRGPLDAGSERVARATMTAVAASVSGPVVVVLEESFVDFRGLAVLLGVARTCRRRGRMLRLVGAPPSLRTMCQVLGVRNCWWEFDRVADALVRREADEVAQLRQAHARGESAPEH
jgi:anti-anti-sigma factor